MAGKEGGKLFADLNRHLLASHFGKALAVANAVLAEDPDDQDAFRCKVFCLLEQAHFKEALALLPAGTELTMERAYCQFRLFQLDDAMATIEASPAETKATAPVRELRAQVLYRQGHFNEAAALYSELLASCEDDYRDERVTNFLASCAAAAYAEPTSDGALQQEAAEAPTTTYELQYNKACLLLASGQYAEGRQLLSQSEASCRKALEEDADITEAEMETELGLVRLQTGVALHLLGKTQEALATYTRFLSQKPTDIGLVAVASNNVIAAHKEDKLFDSKKKLKALTAPGVDRKLTARQVQVMDFNHCLLLLYIGQKDATRKMCDELEAKYPASDIPCLIRACSLRQEKKGNQSIDVLKAYAAAHKTNCERVQLAIAQTHVIQGKPEDALAVVRSIPSLQHRPALVAFQVAVTEQEDGAKCGEVFDQAVAFWTQSDDPEARRNLLSLLMASGKYKTEHKEHQAAADCFRRVIEMDNENSLALALLIQALSHFDLAQAEKYSASLPPLDSTADMDVDALERTSKVQTGSATQGAAASVLAGAGAPLRKPKRKKKKKPGKLPKDYNPNRKPDPERWLPKWQRSTTSSKRKKKYMQQQGGVGRGTQGSDTVSSTQTETPAAPPTKQELQKQQQQQRPKGKKKRKGRGK